MAHWNELELVHEKGKQHEMGLRSDSMKTENRRTSGWTMGSQMATTFWLEEGQHKHRRELPGVGRSPFERQPGPGTTAH